MTLECTHSNYIPYAYGRATRKYGLRVYNLVKFNVQCVDRYLGLWRAGGARGAQTARHAGTATGWRGEKYCTYYREKAWPVQAGPHKRPRREPGAYSLVRGGRDARSTRC